MSIQTSTSSAKTGGSLLKHELENQKGAAVWKSLVRNYFTAIKKTCDQNIQILTVKTNVPKWKKNLITVIYKAPKMNAFEFVGTLMNHLFEIREESNTKHIVCGVFNIDIADESD